MEPRPGLRGTAEPRPAPKRAAAASDVAATFTILALVAGAALAPPVLRRLARHPSPEECEALIERYVELVARAADPAPAASAIAERKALARAAAGQRGFARCEAELTQEEVGCALRVGSADEIERCLP